MLSQPPLEQTADAPQLLNAVFTQFWPRQSESQGEGAEPQHQDRTVPPGGRLTPVTTSYWLVCAGTSAPAETGATGFEVRDSRLLSGRQSLLGGHRALRLVL